MMDRRTVGWTDEQMEAFTISPSLPGDNCRCYKKNNNFLGDVKMT